MVHWVVGTVPRHCNLAASCLAIARYRRWRIKVRRARIRAQAVRDARPLLRPRGAGTRDAQRSGMTKPTDECADLHRIADELELKIHLASMDARDRWQALKPRLAEVENKLARTGERATKVVQDEIAAIGQALHKLRDDLAQAARRS
jgi:hypothetical protein